MMSLGVLDKTITLRQLLKSVAIILSLSLVIWMYLGFKHAYFWYMVGPGLRGSPFTNYPAKCDNRVRVHEGQGNAPGIEGRKSFFLFHNRTFVGPISSLIDYHECANWEILTGLHIGPHANYRLIYNEHGQKIVTINVDYHMPYVSGVKK